MDKLQSIHYLRGTAIFFIVVFHSSLFIQDPSEPFANIFLAFLREWTAVFLLISGFLFQYLLPRYSPRAFFKSKLKHVILPYLLISIPAILLYISGIKSNHNWVDLAWLHSHPIPFQVAFYYVTGAHLGPLWFIPLLALIFICSPLLAVLGRNKRALLITLPICITTIALTKRPENDANIVLAFAHFAPVYIIGMCMCAYRDQISNIMGKRVYFNLACLAFIISFVLTVYVDQTAAVFQKIVLFVILYHVLDSVEDYTAGAKLWAGLADASFAIYFLHGYFISGIRMFFNFDTNNIATAVTLTVVAAIVITAVCYTGALIVKTLFPAHSRLLVGA